MFHKKQGFFSYVMFILSMLGFKKEEDENE